MRFVSYMTPGFPVSLFEALAEVMGAELHLDQQMSGPPPGDDPFRDGRFDLGWVCSTAYVDLALRGKAPSVQLAGVAWVPDDPAVEGRPVYFGDVVVRADSEIASLADLAGHAIGCNDPVSLSGHHALLYELQHQNHDSDQFADLVFTGGHHASLDQLIGGSLDAAVVDSVVRIGRARHDDDVAGLRVVKRLGPWPVQPLVARVDLSSHVVRRIRGRLLAANADRAMQRELKAASLTRLVPVAADHYASVHAAMSRT
jgi:phosphonate transport system substrate-binding protein